MIEKWLENPSAITVAGILLFAVIAFVKEIVVPGVTHRRDIADLKLQISKLESENERLDDRIYRLLGYADKAADLAVQATRRSS